MINKPNKLSKLEAIRGFAAIYVVLHHNFSYELIIAGINFSFLFRFGQEAVILFFILSGFVIQYSFINSNNKSFFSFFLKRWLRIYVPLICVFICNFYLLTINNQNLINSDYKILLGNLLMLQDASFLKPNVICDSFLGNTPLWSLSYEWWFYMIFFLITSNLTKNRSHIVYIIGIIAAISYVFYPFFVNRELMYLVIWWIGADIAYLYNNNKEFSILNLKTPIFYLISCIVILIINLRINLPQNFRFGVSPMLELRHFLFAFCAILFAIIWSKLKWVGFKYSIGLFKYIAPISFGIYISHYFLIIHAHYLDTIISNVHLRLLGYYVICILFSFIIERIIYTKINKIAIKLLNAFK